MRAITVIPRQPDSLEVADLPGPDGDDEDLLVDGIALGICGTDHEILSGTHGSAPANRERLIIGHESLGKVRSAPDGTGFFPGDLVVGVVRRPDPVPCGACARGQFDMCRNGKYSERGIKNLDGFGSQQWTINPDYAVRLDPALEQVGMLLEPTTIVAKAWEQIELIGARAWFQPERALITGAGPIGLLAALLGRQRGLDIHVLDQVKSGPKPGLVADLGGTYHATDINEAVPALKPDIIIEATGAAPVILGAISHTQPYGITCLTGVSSGGRKVPIDPGALNTSIVLENEVIVGSVNANLNHYHHAIGALEKADVSWLNRLITRRIPLENASEAFHPNADDIKVVIDL